MDVFILFSIVQDMEVDREIQRVFHSAFRLRRQCSIFMIAHRLDTLRDADEILVMEGGSLKERGTPEVILRKYHNYNSHGSNKSGL